MSTYTIWKDTGYGWRRDSEFVSASDAVIEFVLVTHSLDLDGEEVVGLIEQGSVVERSGWLVGATDSPHAPVQPEGCEGLRSEPESEYVRVKITDEELDEWYRTHETPPRVHRVRCTRCGKRMWLSGLGLGSHRRWHARQAARKEEV